jgi:hypothetical protein
MTLGPFCNPSIHSGSAINFIRKVGIILHTEHESPFVEPESVMSVLTRSVPL